MTHWLLWLATLIAMQAGSVSAARASCGNYLVHELPDPMPLPVPQTPCRGCQKAPANPGAPAPVQLAPECERLGCLTDALPVVASERSEFDTDQSDRPVRGELPSIEHPPRGSR